MKKLSVNQQFWVVTSVILCVCALLFSCSFLAIGRLMSQRNMRETKQNMDYFVAEMRFLNQRVNALYSTLLTDDNVAFFAESAFSERSAYYIKDLQLKLSAYSSMNNDIVDIAIMSESFIWSGYLDATTANELYNKLGNSGALQCLGLQKNAMQQRKGEGPYLLFGQNFFANNTYGENRNRIGAIFVAFDLSKTYVGLPSATQEEGMRFTLDETGTWYAFDCDEDTTADVVSEYEKRKLMNAQYKERYIFQEEVFPEQRLTLLYAIDKRANNGGIVLTAFVFFVAIVFTTLLLILAMRVILRNVLVPLKTMSDYLRKGSLCVGKQYKPLALTGCTEIVALSDAYNIMLVEQQRLNEELQQRTIELYESALSRKQAELEYLRSQINPHFLYNTLGMMQDMAIDNNLPQLADIAQAMAMMFRYSIKGGQFVKISQELEIIEAYLKIQNARFNGKIKVFYSVRDELLNQKVMKLLLQPLVENAIVHGILPKQGEGTIYIGVKKEHKFIILSIYDDGVGIESHKLRKLQKQMDYEENDNLKNNGDSEHLGLINVHRRLFLQYGKGYGLQIESTKNLGTRIQITMPFQMELEDNNEIESSFS